MGRDANMHVHCLGTTGYHPSPTRHTACYYLPDQALVLDAGTGLFRIIEQLLKRPQRQLDILLSHVHLDHIVGLTFLLDALAVTELKKVRVFAEEAKILSIREHLYAPAIFPVLPDYEFVPLPSDSGKLTLGETQIDYFPLEHPGGALGFVMENDGKRLAYVTDTVADAKAAYLAELTDIDLLMHECYFNDDNQELAIKTGHSWLSAVTQVVRAVCPKRTALIHINPLAEVLGSGFQLTADHCALDMFVTEDQQVIEI